MTAPSVKKMIWSLDIAENPANPDGLYFSNFDTKLDYLKKKPKENKFEKSAPKILFRINSSFQKC